MYICISLSLSIYIYIYILHTRLSLSLYIYIYIYMFKRIHLYTHDIVLNDLYLDVNICVSAYAVVYSCALYEYIAWKS